ncbi:MAG: HD-GYP domain-containing protein [Thermodesulfobacteriota bacterium]
MADKEKIKKEKARSKLYKDLDNNDKKLQRVDKELIMIFLMVIIVAFIHLQISAQEGLLNLFYFPVLFGAYFFGRRHSTFSAVLATVMVFSLAYFIPENFQPISSTSELTKWTTLTIWGGFLIVTGWAMGTLYEKKEKSIRELTTTYQGIFTMLSLVIDSVDKYTQSHSYRVSRYSEMLARAANLKDFEVEEIRIAALLHDLGKIGVSAHVLNKVGRLSEDERGEMEDHTSHAAEILSPFGDRVLNILPLILNHHERYDGKGYHGLLGDEIPIGAKIIAIADVYDALITDRPYRKALTPSEVEDEIIRGTGTHFDPKIVDYFKKVSAEMRTEHESITMVSY